MSGGDARPAPDRGPKAVRAAAGFAAAVDLGFAFVFLAYPDALAKGGNDFPYPRWMGICQLASAALLIMVATDAKRFFPVLAVNLAARVAVVAIGFIYVFRQLALVVTVAAADGAVSAIFVFLILNMIREWQEREDAKLEARKALEQKPAPPPPGGSAVRHAAPRPEGAARPAPPAPAPAKAAAPAPEEERQSEGTPEPAVPTDRRPNPEEKPEPTPEVEKAEAPDGAPEPGEGSGPGTAPDGPG